MSPIEITEIKHKQSENQPNTSTLTPDQQQQQQQQEKEQQQQQEDRANEDINNNISNHRKRSCSSTSSSLATEKRRSARLLKKHIEEEQQHQHYQASKAEFCTKRAARMLSKIKQTAGSAAADARASSFSHHNNNNNNNNNNNSNNNNSDTEDNNNDLDLNDSNNNQLEAPIQPSKLTQDELMDIVEVSRKRRLSKGSADTLGSFIKWSFTHIESSQERRRRDSFSLFEKQHTLVIENNNNVQKIKSLADDGELLDDEDDWSTLSNRNQSGKLPTTEQLLRQHAKLSAVAQCGGSSAANLALLRHQSSLIAAQEGGARLIKRPRTHMYSPESKLSISSPTGERRKVSGYLGNVVERLHKQQQQQQKATPSVQQDADTSEREQESNSGLSYHLQQFLSQQTSLEDLCSSVGLDDSNQLVLAAAIHRALVDSVGSSGNQANENVGSKSTASSTGGSSIGSSSNSAGGAAGGATLHQVDALTGRRRTYNTRGGLAAGLGASGLGQSSQQLATRQQSSSTAATLAALNINSRVQQQRHAQAAAALSALANAGLHHNQQSHHHSSHHVASSTPIAQQFPLSTNLSASIGAQSMAGGQSLTAGGAAGNGAGGNPMVDFECETCGSSFDDRHRLMQHQSIHLELKKDWFTETPVDEVMKIFNRRRGEFLCNTCNLRFEATFDYDKHNHQVHGQRPYCCQFCGNGTRTFRFWRQYLNHLYDHRYIFSCTIEDCDFTVNRRDSLRFHIFRFHLNCQLPQQQTHIRSAGHQHNLMLSASDSKWPMSMGVHHDGIDDDVDDLDRDSEMNIGD